MGGRRRADKNRDGASRTVQLVSLEMLGSRVKLAAVWVVAGKAARGTLPARALVWGGPSTAVLGLGLRRLLGVHGAGFWVWLQSMSRALALALALALCRAGVGAVSQPAFIRQLLPVGQAVDCTHEVRKLGGEGKEEATKKNVRSSRGTPARLQAPAANSRHLDWA
jgi:hypothetical protein